MPANPVCGINIKAPEPVVKGTPVKGNARDGSLR